MSISLPTKDEKTRPARRPTSAPGWPRRGHLPQRDLPAPKAFLATLLGALVSLGFGITLALGFSSLTTGALLAPGGLMIALGNLAGLTATYFLLVTLLLISRLPALEASIGQDKLVRWHRRLGPWIVVLLVAHAFFITLGYAQSVRTGVLAQIGVFVRSYPGMLGAFVGLGLILLAAVTSYRNVRRRMRYETWWSVHLYTYLAVALSFSHQLLAGQAFLHHPWASGFWVVLWFLTAGVVIIYRFGVPIVRSFRHRLRVVSVHEEAPGVVSVILRGRDLDRLPVSGGQFLQWRFLTRHLWWQAHPYSLSALPTSTDLRITVKTLGDHSSALARLRPGTYVAIEGPYGAFTRHSRSTDRLLLVGAGVGVTPVRAMLDDLPSSVDVVVILRASSQRELVLRDEIAELVRRRRGRLHEVIGPRARAPLDAPQLRSLVPDIAERDLYVCGPEGFMRGLRNTALSLGVPGNRIHNEDFAF
jgi:predicted ferric reductase